MAGKYNLKIDQGATLRLFFKSLDFDLAGYTARSQLRKTYGGDLVAELVEGDGLETDPENNGIWFELPHTMTEGMSGGGVWDMEITNGDSVYRLFEGNWSVSPEVTT